LVDDGTTANTRSFTNIKDFKTYTITENALSGWALDSLVCGVTSPNGGSQTPNGSTVSINLKEGENVTCTYTNHQLSGTLTVIKHVVNDNGGSATAANFNLHVKSGASDVSGSPAAGSESGTSYTLNQGAYVVSEDSPIANYTQVSFSGDCDSSGNVAVVAGQTKTCTITNNDNAPQLHLRKTITNDNGGSAAATDWTLTATGTGGSPTNLNGSTPVDSNATFKADTYALGETGPSGYTPGAWNCGGATMPDATHVTVPFGGNVTCTINNNDNPAHLIVVKHVINNNGGSAVAGDFSTTISGVTTATPTAPGVETPGVDNVLTTVGSYSVDEGAHAGYTKTLSAECSGTIALGQTKTCTITNDDQQAYIVVDKTVVNNNGGSAVANDFLLTVDGNAVSDEVAYAVNPGAHVAGETNLPNYTAGTWGGDCNVNASVSVALGQTKTCTITNNDDAPQLHLRKTVTNDNGGTQPNTAWNLTATGADQSPTNLSGSTPVDSDATFKADTYALGETGPANYTASTWNCGNATMPDATHVTVPFGANVTCTINNDDNAAHLIVIKHVVNDNGGGAIAADFTMAINTVTAEGGNSFPGEEAPGTNKTLTTVGAYSVTETGLPGYAQSSSADCTGTIAIGQTKTCTITNDDIAPTLKLVKSVTNNNGGTKAPADWTLTATGSGGFSDTGDSTTFHTVSAAVGYDLSESAVAGYDSEGWSCDGGTLVGSTVTLALDQDVTCTITNNDQAPHLIVIKHVINDNGGTKLAGDFSGTITGVTVTGGGTWTGAEAPGVNKTLTSVGAYNVAETADADYTTTYSADCTGSIALGETKTCTVTNDDKAAHLIVIKHVVNDNGGPSVASDFLTTITGVSTATPTAAGVESPGVDNVLTTVGSYSVDEGTHLGYDKTLSADCTGTIALGQTKTCTITNDDQAAHLIVIKHVINDNGGTKLAGDFTMAISGVTATGGNSFAGAEAPGVNKTLTTIGSYNVGETLLSGYEQVSLSADCSGSITLGETKTCTITNNDIAPPITRTLGFWQTHFDFTSTLFNNTKNQGIWILCNGQPVIRKVNTTNELFGGFLANVAKTTTGVKRTALDQARMQLLQQLLAAILNHLQFGSGTDAMLDAAKAAYCGTDRNAILAQVTILDNFNNSGDSLPAGVNTGKADPKNSKGIANYATWDALP
jgi:hypothetical protein